MRPTPMPSSSSVSSPSTCLASMGSIPQRPTAAPSSWSKTRMSYMQTSPLGCAVCSASCRQAAYRGSCDHERSKEPCEGSPLSTREGTDYGSPSLATSRTKETTNPPGWPGSSSTPPGLAMLTGTSAEQRACCAMVSGFFLTQKRSSGSGRCSIWPSFRCGWASEIRQMSR